MSLAEQILVSGCYPAFDCKDKNSYNVCCLQWLRTVLRSEERSGVRIGRRLTRQRCAPFPALVFLSGPTGLNGSVELVH